MTSIYIYISHFNDFIYIFQIIWVEHVAVQDQIINDLSKSIIRSGYAYGAKHWISTLERQCERISSVIGDTSYPYGGILNEIGKYNYYLNFHDISKK